MMQLWLYNTKAIFLLYLFSLLSFQQITHTRLSHFQTKPYISYRLFTFDLEFFKSLLSSIKSQSNFQGNNKDCIFVWKLKCQRCTTTKAVPFTRTTEVNNCVQLEMLCNTIMFQFLMWCASLCICIHDIGINMYTIINLYEFMEQTETFKNISWMSIRKEHCMNLKINTSTVF